MNMYRLLKLCNKYAIKQHSTLHLHFSAPFDYASSFLTGAHGGMSHVLEPLPKLNIPVFMHQVKIKMYFNYVLHNYSEPFFQL